MIQNPCIHEAGGKKNANFRYLHVRNSYTLSIVNIFFKINCLWVSNWKKFYRSSIEKLFYQSVFYIFWS